MSNPKTEKLYPCPCAISFGTMEEIWERVDFTKYSKNEAHSLWGRKDCGACGGTGVNTLELVTVRFYQEDEMYFHYESEGGE